MFLARYVHYWGEESYCNLILRKWQEAGGRSLRFFHGGSSEGKQTLLRPPWPHPGGAIFRSKKLPPWVPRQVVNTVVTLVLCSPSQLSFWWNWGVFQQDLTLDAIQTWKPGTCTMRTCSNDMICVLSIDKLVLRRVASFQSRLTWVASLTSWAPLCRCRVTKPPKPA